MPLFRSSKKAAPASSSYQVAVVDQLLPSPEAPLIKLDSQVKYKGKLMDVRVICNPNRDSHLVEQLSRGCAYISMSSPSPSGVKLMYGSHKLGHLAIRNNMYSAPEIDDLENSRQSECTGPGQALVEFACRLAIANNHYELKADSLEGSAAFYFKMGFRFPSDQSVNNQLLAEYMQKSQSKSGLRGEMLLNLRSYDYGIAELNKMAYLLSRYLQSSAA